MRIVKKGVAYVIIMSLVLSVFNVNVEKVNAASSSRVEINTLKEFTKYLKDNVSNLKSDKQGRYILYMYLYGVSARKNLKTEKVTIDGKEKEYPIVQVTSWGKYMKKEGKLKKRVKKLLKKEFKSIKKGKSKKIKLKVMGTMYNGEQIIGTQYLHNTRDEVGGFTIKGTAKKDKNGKVTANLKFGWNDIIDPNYAYPTDELKAKFAKTLAGDHPTDYIIRVKWSSKVVQDPAQGRDNKNTWPFK